MCKIMAFAGLKDDKKIQERAWEWLLAAQPSMNASDKDGIGFSMQLDSGKLFGERWFKPTDAFNYRPEADATLDAKLVELVGKENVSTEDRYNTFGEYDGFIRSVIFHSRMATCAKNLNNVHPFVKEHTAIIHNGIINNDSKLKKEFSTCDSEVILHEYIDKEVANNPDNIKKLGESLEGYYGVAVQSISFDQAGSDGKLILDIFRESAQISCAYVEELDTVVFCTSESIIVDTVKKLKWTMGNVFKVEENKLLRLDSTTGKLISTTKFETGKKQYGTYGYYENGKWNRYSQGSH